MKFNPLTLMSIASLSSKACWPIYHRCRVSVTTVSAFAPLQYRQYGYFVSRKNISKLPSSLQFAASIQNRCSNSTAAFQSLTRSSIRRMKRAELRQELEARGLESHGLRDELLKRLINYLDGGKTSNLQSNTMKSVENNVSERTAMKFRHGSIYVLRYFGLRTNLEASAACGVIIYDYETQKVVWSGRNYFSLCNSAVEAEYLVLNETLQMVHKTGVNIKIVIQGDENGVVLKQLQGINKVNKKELQGLFSALKNTINNSNFVVEKIMGIPVEHNRKVRLLAKKALTTRTSAGFDTPKTQSKAVTSSYMPISASSEKVYVLQFDGGSRGNPGVSGAGMVILEQESGLEIWSGSLFLDTATNNVAEYTALLTGLKCAKAIGVKQIIVQGDSQLVVNQILGKYKVKAENLQPIWRKAKSLSEEFQKFSINFIPRAENSRSDELANKAMDGLCSEGLDCIGVL